MKVKTLAVVVKSDNGKIYQVSLNQSEVNAIREIISGLHGGKIKILEEEITTIDIKES